LNFWSEIGLFGLLAFLGIIVWFYKIGIRNREYGISIILMAAMTALLVHGLVDVPYFKNDLSVLFWILVASEVVILRSKATKDLVNNK
jgi:O-antigen ligase